MIGKQEDMKTLASGSGALLEPSSSRMGVEERVVSHLPVVGELGFPWIGPSPIYTAGERIYLSGANRFVCCLSC